MRPRIPRLGHPREMIAHAEANTGDILISHVFHRIEQSIKDNLLREENSDIRHNTVRMRHFHDNQNKVKRFRK